jgi:peptidyl-prolyl cis-trans isomerase A (cyclophilin A)
MKQTLLTMLLMGCAFAQTKATSAAKPAAAKPDLMNPASLTAKAPESYQAKFTTTKGVVIIEVTRAWAPRGADRFYNLVRAGYFTDAPFFRVVPNFMAQFGIIAKPEVNRALGNASFADDPKTAHSNTRGMVTFATTGAPNTRGTQLFINYKDNSFLDPQGFLPIGQVVEGMEIVDQFYSGYGDTVNKEGDLENGGKAYVDRNMPKLDRIVSATIVPATPAAPKPAADAKK